MSGTAAVVAAACLLVLVIGRTGGGTRGPATGAATTTVYVASTNEVMPISTATNRAGPPIQVGAGPSSMAAVPFGQTVYVVDSGSGTGTPSLTGPDRRSKSGFTGRDPDHVLTILLAWWQVCLGGELAGS